MDIERWKSYLDFNRWNMKKGNRGRRGYRTSSIIHIAKERIEVLLNESEVMAKKKDLHYMRRYVDIAMAIGKKYNIRFPIEKKDHICKKCHATPDFTSANNFFPALDNSTSSLSSLASLSISFLFLLDRYLIIYGVY